MSHYPFKLSNNIHQQIIITLTFSYKPQLIITNKPTTTLNITIQLQILHLLKHKTHTNKTTILFINHNITIISQLYNNIYIIYTKNIIKNNITTNIIHHPQHPYTINLLQYTPKHKIPHQLLPTIPKTIPNLTHLPNNYTFHNHYYTTNTQYKNIPTLTTYNNNNQHYTY